MQVPSLHLCLLCNCILRSSLLVLFFTFCIQELQLLIMLWRKNLSVITAMLYSEKLATDFKTSGYIPSCCIVSYVKQQDSLHKPRKAQRWKPQKEVWWLERIVFPICVTLHPWNNQTIAWFKLIALEYWGISTWFLCFRTRESRQINTSNI